GLPHTFWNATTQPARLLELISPAGFEKYFAELADLLRTGGDVDQITSLAEKYGMELRWIGFRSFVRSSSSSLWANRARLCTDLQLFQTAFDVTRPFQPL